MTTNPPAQPRWAEFSDAERTIIRHGCAEVMEDILHAAATASIPTGSAEDAAGTLLIAARLAFEIDDAEGDDHPPLEIFAETSRQIAAGTYHVAIAAVAAGRTEEEVRRAAAVDDMSWPTPSTGVQAVTPYVDRTPRPLGARLATDRVVLDGDGTVLKNNLGRPA